MLSSAFNALYGVPQYLNCFAPRPFCLMIKETKFLHILKSSVYCFLFADELKMYPVTNLRADLKDSGPSNYQLLAPLNLHFRTAQLTKW